MVNLVEGGAVAAIPMQSIVAVKKDRDGSDEGTQVGHRQPEQVHVHHPLPDAQGQCNSPHCYNKLEVLWALRAPTSRGPAERKRPYL